ncbi:unnamed protein product [Microthlaspi erraticum]|uniref:Uncharacterized protein n=1 Tax=Microthlaspi erraticum TaxID=1685480 RepID=A0A6D2KDM9_9BRAS|nr:unnamed protein product [Microthlaspi erraticum]
MWRILKTKCILQGIHNNKDLLTNLKEVNFSQGKGMSRDIISAQGAICFFTKSSSSKPTRWDFEGILQQIMDGQKRIAKRCMRRWTLCSAISTPSMMLLPLM